MAIGIFANALAIIIGGLIGAFLENRISSGFEEKINMIFGVCSLSIAISTIILMENMPAVVLSVILGTAIGIVLHLEELVNKGGRLLQKGVNKIMPVEPTRLSPEEFQSTLLTIIVLFCASGTGIYGSLIAGISGDNNILIAKSILDLFTALIFACSLGSVVSIIAVPQFIIFMFFYFIGGFIIPHVTPAMVNDFKACGGFLMLATGFRIIRVKMFPIADMIPAMFIVWPISYYWVAHIIPFLNSFN